MKLPAYTVKFLAAVIALVLGFLIWNARQWTSEEQRLGKESAELVCKEQLQRVADLITNDYKNFGLETAIRNNRSMHQDCRNQPIKIEFENGLYVIKSAGRDGIKGSEDDLQISLDEIETKGK